ncbi:MAG: hypothetical protein NTW78_07435 [Campylobacterales bacterium]|nr:hypothetical protein [Campylobacterales bacterium]
MILSAKDIGIYIDEFKKISYDDIINRNGYLSVEEIDTSIKELSDDIAIDSILIKQELHDLMQMLDSQHNLNSMFDFDAEDAETFKKYIIQIKINALSEVKKTMQKSLSQISHALHASAPATNGVTIKDAIQEYIHSKSGISKAVAKSNYNQRT